MVCYLFRICAIQTVNYLRKWVVARLTLTVSRPDWGGVVPLFSHRWCILQPQPLGPTLNCLTFHCPRGLLHDKFIFGQLDRYWCWDWDTNDSFVQNHPAAQLNVTVMAAALPFLLSRSLLWWCAWKVSISLSSRSRASFGFASPPGHWLCDRVLRNCLVTSSSSLVLVVHRFQCSDDEAAQSPLIGLSWVLVVMTII